MSTFSIRPHHLLCLFFFEGKGYNEAFVTNMQHILRELETGSSVIITDGTDGICDVCPHNHNGRCDTEEKVQSFDDRVCSLCKLKIGGSYPFHRLKKKILSTIIQPRKLSCICGSCEWYGLCSKSDRLHRS